MSLSARRGAVALLITTAVATLLVGCSSTAPTASNQPAPGAGPLSSSSGTRAPRSTAPAKKATVPVAPVKTVTVAAAPLVSVSPPVAIKIPAMFIDQPLIGLRVNRSDGSLTPPSGWNDIGWWNGGPAPGAPGAAIIAAHVDSDTGPAVFAGLGSLKDGSAIVIDRADGSIATYAVYKMSYFDRDHFPNDVVYRETGPSELHLVTCSGQWNRQAHDYSQNYVVFAKLVNDTTRAS